MLIIRDLFDTFGLGPLGGSLGSLLGALGGSLGFTSGALGCSAVSLGALLASFWMLLRPPAPPIRCSRVLQNYILAAFAAQTPTSRTCYYSQRNIVICNARRVGLGAQNRPEEGSQGVKRPVRRGLTEMRRDEKQYLFNTRRIDNRQRLLSASVDPWDLEGTRLGSENELEIGSPLDSSLAGRGKPFPHIGSNTQT